MVIIVIRLLIEKKSLSLKLTMKIRTIELNSVWEADLMNLMLLILEQFLLIELSMIFRLITILII